MTSLNNYRTALDTAQRVRFAEMIAGPANNDRSRLVDELTAADPARPLPGGTGVRASKVYGDFLAELDAAETGIRDELASTTQAARSTAVNLAVINVAVLLAALVIGAIIVGLIARAIISSLRTLRGSALEVAQKSLPDAVARMRGGTVPDVNVTPVPVHTREEVGEVARAFDAVHEQAVRLAAEQATLQNTVNSMFVNLSRRSQSLVDRQLQLIEELESNEQDPDQLASLFRLDHLATRMRRNSENLLVLAGHRPGQAERPPRAGGGRAAGRGVRGRAVRAGHRRAAAVRSPCSAGRPTTCSTCCRSCWTTRPASRRRRPR